MPNFELEHVSQLVIEQNNARKAWQEQSTEFIAEYAREEFRELEEAQLPQENEWDRWEIASEIGDVEYLSVKLESRLKEGESLPADVLFFRNLARGMAEYLGIDIASALHLKVIRNDLKYPASIANSHDYEDGRQKSKQLWEMMGGDKAFYKWYKEVFGMI